MCFSAVLLEMYWEMHLSRLGLRAAGGVFSLLPVLFARFELWVKIDSCVLSSSCLGLWWQRYKTERL